MKAPSGNVIPAHGLGQVTQTVLLNNPNKARPSCFSCVWLCFSLNLSVYMNKFDYTFISPIQVSLKMRIRVSYSHQGAVHQDTVQIDSFPSLGWNCQPSISPLWLTYEFRISMTISLIEIEIYGNRQLSVNLSIMDWTLSRQIWYNRCLWSVILVWIV